MTIKRFSSGTAYGNRAAHGRTATATADIAVIERDSVELTLNVSANSDARAIMRLRQQDVPLLADALAKAVRAMQGKQWRPPQSTVSHSLPWQRR